MNPKIAKLRAELEKNTERIARLQARNGELKQQIQELESAVSLQRMQTVAEQDHFQRHMI